jgi:hypothetical protein
MRRLLQGTFVLGLLLCVVSGCGEPRYGYYGNPGYGYAPYSYGFGRGYSPDFRRLRWRRRRPRRRRPRRRRASLKIAT